MAAWYPASRALQQLRPLDALREGTASGGSDALGELATRRPACHDRGVDRQRPRLRSPLSLTLLGLAALSATACSKSPPAEVADRLWIAEMPTSPRSQIDAFVVTEVAKRSYGSFYHGSLYRGVHDSFQWTSKAKDKAVIRILQDERDFPITTKSCRPDIGFDECILLEGDPKKVVRYQSRKRWKVPRRGQSLDVPTLMLELGEDDEDIAALIADDE
jgi:hypothetical protein